LNTAEKVQEIIRYSQGTEQYHRYSSILDYPIITDGVKAVAEVAGAYWLLDVIASYQHNKKLDKAFQVWKLAVNLTECSGVVRGYNDTKRIITQKIPFTDFPLDKFTLYLIDGIVLLPSEY